MARRALRQPRQIDDTSRSEQKHEAILNAGMTVFLRNGYLGASLDEVAALAAVSKQTVYKHFSDKETLFFEIVTRMVKESSDNVETDLLALEAADNVEIELCNVALRRLEFVMQPHLMKLRRLVIGEVARFPALAKAYYEGGLERAVTLLAASLQRLADRGLLVFDDPLTAASHLNALITSAPVNRALLLGDEATFTPEELRRHVRDSVRMFLTAYGNR